MKLYKLPRNSPLRVSLRDGTLVNATFHHIDGAYSYCTLDKDSKTDNTPKAFHLRAWEEMVEINGRWEVLPE